MTDVIIYHNPECGTSRNTLAMIRNAGIEPHVIEYLKTPPSRIMLTQLIERAGLTPRALLREKGTPFAELGLADESLSDDALIDAMMAHPILINRPLVVTTQGARLCRPSEVVLDILPQPQQGGFTKEDGARVVDARGRHPGCVACPADVRRAGPRAVDQAAHRPRPMGRRSRRDLRANPDHPGNGTDATRRRSGERRALYHGGILVHLHDQLRQPGDHRRTLLERQLRWDRALLRPGLHRRATGGRAGGVFRERRFVRSRGAGRFMTRLRFEDVANNDPSFRVAREWEGLPTDDLDKFGSNYFMLRDDKERIGYIGMEGAGPDALLRSLVVRRPRTGKGYGRILVIHLEEMARGCLIERLHLLTSVKTQFFFEACGYRVADRGTAPPAIACTAQFRTLSPADAPYMTKSLT